MNIIKKALAMVWMIMGPLAFFGLIYTAFTNINGEVKGDMGNPIPWIIILCIFAPISIGFSIFGWYCWRDEYKEKNPSYKEPEFNAR